MKTARISVGDVRLEGVSALGRLLHYEAYLYCARLETNGEIMAAPLRKLGAKPALVAELVKAGLWSTFDDGSVVVGEFLKHNPANSQAERAREAARVRQSRHRHGDSNTVSHGVTGSVTNAVTESVTPSALPDLSGSDLISSDPESYSPLSSSSYLTGSARKSPKRARRTALGVDWAPNESHRKRARETDLDLELEAAKFRLHAEGTGRMMANWDAAFTTWLINAYEYQSRVRPASGFVSHEQQRQADRKPGSYSLFKDRAPLRADELPKAEEIQGLLGLVR